MDERIEVALKGEEFKRLLGNQFIDIKNRYGLKTVDIEILLYLSKCGEENTPSDIYRRIRINKGHISQGIDDLVKKGYIRAFADVDDRRVCHYMITESSDTVIEEIIGIKKNLERKILFGLTDDEVEQYKVMTCRILRNIEAMLQ